MSVAVVRDRRPGEECALEIFVAFQSIYNQYWEPAIEELGIRCFIAPTCFGKDKLEQALRELGMMRGMDEQECHRERTGTDHSAHRSAGEEAPEAFDREGHNLCVGWDEAAMDRLEPGIS